MFTTVASPVNNQEHDKERESAEGRLVVPNIADPHFRDFADMAL